MVALNEVVEHCLVEAGAKAKAELAMLATTTAEKDFMVNYTATILISTP
jgi:hypothetical protein